MNVRRNISLSILSKTCRFFQGRELAEFCREQDVGEMQEVFFQDKLRKTIYEARDVQTNPFREPLVGKHIKQCLRPV